MFSAQEDEEEVIQDSLGATFLAWAVEPELYIYATEKSKAHPSLLQALLNYALHYGLYGKYMDQDPIMLKHLLGGGGPEALNDENSAPLTAWLLGRG
ncbi:uncharacterized protein LY89DRAFT_444128 [Mollisia scopiformis]|uniref:Uncharacterized protein n=1 Tax=Mollisia scopiformis TaxID=149040 RepID=A0A194XK02_MOLSC|nr:uncharacterized protein LY89DRAFT_444128 [Mollisia scopiformis]KUJ20466.1 hypothetical protein LY89DRAFT_444128 [Mollisia scopiformis]